MMERRPELTIIAGPNGAGKSADYFAQRAEDDIDRLWDEGILSEEVMEEWKTEHMRTPYAQ